MTISRRTVLKQLGVITGGILLLPGCVKHDTVTALHTISVTGDQQKMLADLVDVMIPAGQLPGALALNVDKFVWKMVDDCQAPANQKIFLDGFADLDARSKKQFNSTFLALTKEQKISLLGGIEKEATKNAPADKKAQPPTFLSLTKKYTIQGYLQSEYVMTNVTGYNMIPGRFDGCIPMAKNKNIILG